MALLEARRKKLAAEGIFDAARKRNAPFLPRVVGVVTSPGLSEQQRIDCVGHSVDQSHVFLTSDPLNRSA